MKNAKVLLSTFLICILNQTFSQIIQVDLLAQPDKEMKNLSDIASKVEYIPLQTSESSLTGFIYGITITGNRIYINALNRILCFDKSGNYIYNLNKNGRGPDEYTSITDFDVNQERKIMIILDNKKILEFQDTGRGFTFIKSLNLKDSPSNIDFSPDLKNIWISLRSSGGNEPYRYFLINLNGETLKTILNNNKYIKNSKMFFFSKSENLLFPFDKSLRYKYWLCDTLFSIDQSNFVSPYIVFNSHGKGFTTKTLANISFETFTKYLKMNMIMETQRYLIYTYSMEPAGFLRIFDKTTGKIAGFKYDLKTELPVFKDNIVGGIDFEPKYCIDGLIYSWVDAIKLKEYIAGENFRKAAPKDPVGKEVLKKLTSSLKETDNPVLIVVTPKK
jgi:hypothetical protein